MGERIRVESGSREQLIDITDEVQARVQASGVRDGLAFLWSMHTTCAITVNEGADPDVARDLETALRGLAPRDGDYRHAEGNSDSHLKVLLTGPGQTLLVEDGRLVLGTWQRVFLAEWDGPRTRTVALTVQPSGLD